MYPTKKLGEILDIQSGYAFDSKLFNETEGFPIVRIRDIKNSYTQTKYLGKVKEDYIIKKGDFLIGMDGEFKCYIRKGLEALLNQRVCRFVHKNSHSDLKYIFYGVNQFLKTIEDNTPFVTVKHISTKQIKNIQIPLPPLPTQKLIVQKLDSSFEKIDKSIELIKKNLQNLEQLNKSILESFGDFKKVLVGDIVEKLFAGGDLPKDKSYSKEKTKAYNIPIYANAIKEDGLYGYTHTAKVFDNAITISARGTIGFTKLRLEPFYPIVRLLVLVPKKELADLKYLEYILNTINLKQFGSSIPQLSVPQLKSFKIPLPPLKKQKEIVAYLDKVFEKNKSLKSEYERKLKDLEEMKQSLLKEAFEGRLVKE